MTELELHKAFFQAWSALEAMPKNKGRPSAELKAAQELVHLRAAAIRTGNPTPEVKADPAAAEYRTFAMQVAAIAPQDTRGIDPKIAPRSILRG